MTLEHLRKRLSGITGQGERAAKPTVEEAIGAWENNRDGKNPEGYKIVRGIDGKPVEVIIERRGKEPVFAILVNGQHREQFQIGGEMQPIEQALGKLRFEQFLHSDVFDGWYELEGIKRLDAQVSNVHQGFVFGQPGQQPDSLQANFRLA